MSWPGWGNHNQLQPQQQAQVQHWNTHTHTHTHTLPITHQQQQHSHPQPHYQQQNQLQHHYQPNIHQQPPQHQHHQQQQQQNQQQWGNWVQWQSQYLAWQMHYGDKYAEQMQAMGVPVGMQPPLPVSMPVQAPPPPPPEAKEIPAAPEVVVNPSVYTANSYPYPRPQLHHQPPPQLQQQKQPQQQQKPPQQQQQPIQQQYQQPQRQPIQGSYSNAESYSRRNALVEVPTDQNVANQSEVDANSSQAMKEEEEFDRQFKSWEDDFQKWKRDNINHPDREAYQRYESSFLTCRAKLLERKEQMKLKRQRLQREQQQAAYKAIDNPSQTDQNYTKSDFLPSANIGSAGIPGLDLVKEQQKVDEVIEVPENDDPEQPQVVNNQPDLKAISKGIDSILGNEKLLQMISLLNQNKQTPNLAAANVPLGASRLTDQNPIAYQPLNVNQPNLLVDNNYKENTQQIHNVPMQPSMNFNTNNQMAYANNSHWNQPDISKLRSHGGNSTSYDSNMAQNIPNEYLNNKYNQDEMSRNEAQKWADVPLFEPVTIIDYNHKPMVFANIDVFEPAQIFDYNHKSNENFSIKDDERSKNDRRDVNRYYNDDYKHRSTRDDIDRNRRNYDDKYKRRDRSYDRNRDFNRRQDRDKNRHDDYRPRERSRERKSRFSKRSNSREKDYDSNPKRQCIDQNTNFENERSNNQQTNMMPHNIIMIDDILEKPGRDIRPEKIAIIMRGLPGSGKSYLAKLIKDREIENGGSQLRILSLDDYFMSDEEDGKNDRSMKYVYDASMEKTYVQSLAKSFNKTIYDGYFPFVIVDSINSHIDHYNSMMTVAKHGGFKTYVCQMENDVQSCFKRNIHNRKLEDIQRLADNWQPTPRHFMILDPTTLLQAASIDHVLMEDVSDNEMEDADNVAEEQNEDEEVLTTFTSKWDLMEDTDKLARLDGTSKPLRHTTTTIEDFLQLDEWTAKKSDSKKKSVRWADIEEHREQEKLRAIGFVVGQTNWERMADPSNGRNALTQTKYIERIGKY